MANYFLVTGDYALMHYSRFVTIHWCHETTTDALSGNIVTFS